MTNTATLEPITHVTYAMRDGGTITLTKASTGWDLTFDFGSDPSLNFTENLPSIPSAMDVVDTYCDRFAA